MQNWARWKSGAPIGVAISGAYDLEAPGRRDVGSMPLLNGEAADVDQAVSALPPELYDVITVHWLGKRRDRMSRATQQRTLPGGKAYVLRHKLNEADEQLAAKVQGRSVEKVAHAPLERVRTSTIQQRARACGCSERMYFYRLSHAHERIRALMRAKRNEAERRRDQYRRDVRNLDKPPSSSR